MVVLIPCGAGDLPLRDGVYLMRYLRGETVWTGYYNRKRELLFVVTSKPARDYYYLYGVENGELKKLGRAKTPTELETKYHVNEIVCGK